MDKSFYIIAMLSLVTCAWSQSGFAQVGPSGGVNVNVVNTPLPVQGTVTGTVTGSVEISNPATNPVLVRDVNALAKEPFQAATPFVSFTGGGKTTVVVTVPANKRLVIEHVSATVNVTKTGGLANVNIQTSPLLQDQLACQSMGNSPNNLNHFFSCSAQTKFYAQPGQSVSVGAFTADDTSDGDYEVFVSGYFVPVP